MKSYTYKNPLHEELGMMAFITCGNAEDAAKFLEREHDLQTHPTKILRTIEYARPQFEELRQKIAPLQEQTLVHNMGDNALLASEIIGATMEQLKKRIDEGKVPAQFLSRVVRDIADVESKSIEKKMSLEGRPTVITETRNAGEILNALERKGVLKQIEAGDG